MEQKQFEGLEYAATHTYNDLETSMEDMPEVGRQACISVIKVDLAYATAEVQERKETVDVSMETVARHV